MLFSSFLSLFSQNCCLKREFNSLFFTCVGENKTICHLEKFSDAEPLGHQGWDELALVKPRQWMGSDRGWMQGPGASASPCSCWHSPSSTPRHRAGPCTERCQALGRQQRSHCHRCSAFWIPPPSSLVSTEIKKCLRIGGCSPGP